MPTSSLSRLQMSLEATGIGIFEYDITAGHGWHSPACRAQLGYTLEELPDDFARWIDLVDDTQRTAAKEWMSRGFAEVNEPERHEVKFRHKDGSPRWILVNTSVLRDETGAPTHIFGTHIDITEQRTSESIVACQAYILELISKDTPLAETLDALVRRCEAESPGMLGSILLLDDDQLHVRHGAAPSLPKTYWDAIDGEPIGPVAGSCGTAAYRREPVVVQDIATDPLWVNYSSVALAHGLRACWSTPIVAVDGAVMGTFAMYYREPRGPTAHEQRLVAMATSLAAIAIAHAKRLAAVRVGERRYQRLLDANVVGVMIARTDGSIREANDRLLEIIGRTRDELMAGQVRWDSITPPQWKHVDDQIVSDLQAHGIAMPIEKEYLHRDGHPVPILASVAVIDDVRGDCLCLIVDLTDLKAAQAAHVAVLDRISGGYYGLDREWRFTYLNAHAVATIGRPPSDLVGKQIWTEFPGLEELPFGIAYKKAMASQQAQFVEAYYPPYDRWFEVRAYPSSEGLSVFFHDITLRKNAEQALRLSEERYKLLVEHSQDAFLLIDAAGKLAFISPSVRNMLGYDPEELIGTSVFDIHHPEDLARMSASLASKVAAPGTATRREFRLRHKDGSYREISGYGISSTSAVPGVALVGVWQDVTERNQLERMRRESNEQLRRLSQVVQDAREQEQAQIARQIHDQIGQSLTMLKLGLARMLSKLQVDQVALRNDGKELMAQLDDAVQVVRAVASDIRPPLLEDLGIAAALEWAGRRFTDRTQVPCVLDLQVEHVPPEVGRALYAIVQEAFTNISRHARASEVTVRLVRDGPDVVLEVLDDGVGIADLAIAGAKSLGMTGMRERASAVHATFTIGPRDSGGTIVRVRRPTPIEDQP